MKTTLLLSASVALLALSLAAQDMPPVEEGWKEPLTQGGEYASYTFSVTSLVEGAQGGGAGAQPRTAEGKYEKEVGITLKIGAVEAVKVGESAAYKGQDGAWKKVERREKGEPKGEGGQGGGRRDPGRMLGNLKAPHEEIAAMAKGIEKTDSTEKDGDNTVYAVTLSQQGVQDLSPMGRMLRRAEDAEISGKAKIWVNAGGQVVKYEFTTDIKGTFRDREVDIATTKTVELTAIGETKVEIPEEAKKALEGQG